MLYLQTGEKITEQVKNAGFAVTDNLGEAEAVIIEVPLHISDMVAVGSTPASAIITDTLTLGMLRILASKGIKVVTQDALDAKIKELLESTASKAASNDGDEYVVFDSAPDAQAEIPWGADASRLSDPVQAVQKTSPTMSNSKAEPEMMGENPDARLGDFVGRDHAATSDQVVLGDSADQTEEQLSFGDFKGTPSSATLQISEPSHNAQVRDFADQNATDPGWGDNKRSGFPASIDFPSRAPSGNFVERGAEDGNEKWRDLATFRQRPTFAPERSGGMILASFSTKGGAGKTALATNLGVLAAMNKQQRVVLVDMDIGTGNTAEVLGMEDALNGPNVDTWRDYARNLPASLKQHSSGLYLLPTGVNASLTGETVEDLADILCANFDMVVFDFGTKPFFPYTRTGLELASRVFVLALQEQGMVEVLVSRFLAEHKDWVENGKAVLVVNRASPLGYYKSSQVAKMAGFRSYKEIPDDPQSFEAAKKAGKAVVQLRGSAGGEAFVLVANEAFSDGGSSNSIWDERLSGEEKEKRGLFGLFKRR